jgi:methyltransferase
MVIQLTYSNCFTLLILAVAVERLIELVVSNRNQKWSQTQGGVEYSFGHYPFMVFLHTGLLAASLVEFYIFKPKLIPGLVWAMFSLVIASQFLRWWCVFTLGKRWNTRIIIVPNLPRITSGPYRFLQHPNYVAVVVEGFALPMVGFSWITATVFTLLNIPLLFIRIRAENQALATLPTADS